MPDHAPFAALLLLTALAVLVPILLSRITIVRLPVVVGEILAGMVIGQSGFDLVEPTATLAFLQEFGFVLLMFLAGLEVNVDTLLAVGHANGGARWRRPIPLALLSLSLTIALATGIGLLLAELGLTRNALLMGLILSTTSLGIVVPVLKERRLLATTFGQVVLVNALLSDFVTLLLLSFVITLLSQGLSLDLLLFLLLLAAFLAAVRVGPVLGRLPVLRQITNQFAHATAQLEVRGALALMVAWVVLAQALGVEVILGAFLAGAIISLSRQRGESPLSEKLDAIGYGFFIPLFFILVGTQFDAGALLASPTALALVPLLIVAAYLVKLLPALVLRWLLPWRETLAAGALLSSRLSLIIAASTIALDLGIVTEATNAAVIVVAIVTCTCSPLLFNRILPAAASADRSGVIVCGTNQLATLLGERLRHAAEPITFVGRDQAALERLHQAGFQVACGDPADAEVLAAAGAAEARALVVVTTAAETVLNVCRQAQQRFAIPIVIARVDDAALARALRQIEVQVVQPTLATAFALEGALRFPAAFALLADQNDAVEVIDLDVTHPALADRLLREVRLPGNALAIGIRRHGEILVPHGDTVLRRGDVMMLVGSADAVQQAQRWLHGVDEPTRSAPGVSGAQTGTAGHD